LVSSEGLLIIISSPSGAGKTSISKKILENDPRLKFSISATTRSPRSGEKEGVEYYFKSNTEFKIMVESGEMLEYAKVFGNSYGTPKKPVEAALSNGRDVLFDVDWQGGTQIRNSSLKDYVVSVFILPPSLHELENRLLNRGQDTLEIVKDRMMRSREEISHWLEYDYVLVNNNVEKVQNQIMAIILSERLKRTRNASLSELVRKLNVEYDERAK
jgi:guanylate kinase